MCLIYIDSLRGYRSGEKTPSLSMFKAMGSKTHLAKIIKLDTYLFTMRDTNVGDLK